MFRYTDVLNYELIELFNEPGPYYTSYPTLSEWTEACGREEFVRALGEPTWPKAPTILYVHFPFCARQCYYCICNATITRDRQLIQDYLKCLHKNLDLLFRHLEGNPLRETINSVHIGGGSPSFMEPREFLDLIRHIYSLVGRERIEELTVEIDPRTINDEKFDAYYEAGANRLSFGIQDFNDRVQQVVNRVHPFEQIEALLTPALRRRFPSINFDILYGLPLQTRQTFRKTIEQVIQLSPERVALLKYGHVPKRRKHQRILEQYERPEGSDLAWLFFESLDALTGSGWEHISIDNFAKPGDQLAEAKAHDRLGRTFNGFTPSRQNNILGVGSTCTLQLKSHYFQNVYSLDEYMQDMAAGHLPVLRGYRLSREDQLRRDVINSILCLGTVRYGEIAEEYGVDAMEHFSDERMSLEHLVKMGMVEERPEGLFVTALGRGFLRNICKVFDKFLSNRKTYRISGP